MRAPASRSITAGHSRAIFSLLGFDGPMPAVPKAGGPMTELATNALVIFRDESGRNRLKIAWL